VKANKLVDKQQFLWSRCKFRSDNHIANPIRDKIVYTLEKLFFFANSEPSSFEIKE
jgi:hypothetical protein